MKRERPHPKPSLTSVNTDAVIQWHHEANVQLRTTFLARCGGLLTTEEVARLLPSGEDGLPPDPEALERALALFSVAFDGAKGYPAMQFDAETGAPHAALRPIIAALSRDYAGWALAVWWVSANAWLDGRCPLDYWPNASAQVVRAAEAERATMADD
ncbi:hypothetical protein OPU71_18080 [Niveibacterium sp. 24ML]|uniref:hypothetical protein n=1 Tax=Niveibacterium sp. 24ML TaxID=2985512 RepID=UPI00226DD99B|nr:hypothetical protein [Niveibacterium sp. 24ML]MCX9158034.1 hypothetical protein [Niveibacterium sp. 24ML]